MTIAHSDPDALQNDDHAYTTGRVLGALIAAGMQVDPVDTAEGDHTADLDLHLDDGTGIRQTVTIRVLPGMVRGTYLAGQGGR